MRTLCVAPAHEQLHAYDIKYIHYHYRSFIIRVQNRVKTLSEAFPKKPWYR